MSLWYVDNAHANNGNGTSWAEAASPGAVGAWNAFTNIVWASVSPGDTIYLSGGTVSRTYGLNLNIGKSGTSGNYITIDVGANSPSPENDNGTVIIDGEDARQTGIDFGGYDYVKINGMVGSTRYKLQLTGHLDPASGQGTGSGTIDISSCDYPYIDGVKVTHGAGRGITLDGASNVTIDRTWCYNPDNVLNKEQDNIYGQGSISNVVINRCILRMGVTDTAGSPGHNDNIQIIYGTNVTISNNWIEWGAGRGAAADQSTMLTYPYGAWYIYNNVVITKDTDTVNGFLIGLYTTPAPTIYLWNNTFHATNTATGVCVRLYSGMSGSCLTECYNNIFYGSGSGYYGVLSDDGGMVASRFKNNTYRMGGSYIVSNNGAQTLAQWAAAGATNETSEDPDVDTSDEYRLLVTSPCIGTATVLNSSFTLDRDGVTRGDTWDRGAYEYAEAPVATTMYVMILR